MFEQHQTKHKANQSQARERGVCIKWGQNIFVFNSEFLQFYNLTWHSKGQKPLQTTNTLGLNTGTTKNSPHFFQSTSSKMETSTALTSAP